MGRRIHALPKRTPWRHHEFTTSLSDTDCKYATSASCPSHSARPLSLIYRIDKPRPPYRHDNDDSEHDDDRGDTQNHTPYTGSELTSETWSDTEPSSEPQTEWQSILTSAESDGSIDPTDSNSAPSAPAPEPASEEAPVVGTTGATSRTPHASITDAETTMNTDAIYSTPTPSPVSEEASVTGATGAASGTPYASTTDGESTMYTDTIYSTPTSSPVSEEASETGATGATSGTLHASTTDRETTTNTDTIYSTPTSLPVSESASETGATSATSGTPLASSTDEASSSMYSNTIYSPLSSTGSFASSSRSPPITSTKQTSTLPTTKPEMLTETTTSETSSTSSSSWDIIRPNTSTASSLYIAAVITISPESSSYDSNSIGPDGNPLPMRDPFDSTTDSDKSRQSFGAASSGVPLGMIVGSVFGIIFGGLALFCVLFGINKLRQRKQDHECEQRAQRLRMGTGSSSTVQLVHGQEPSGGSAAGSIHTNEQSELHGAGTRVHEPSAGYGRIRFANQRRPSSVPVSPAEGNDPSSTPLMQEYNSPSSAHPPKHHFSERSHSPTVPSPLRTNPVTGRDSPSGWI